MKKLLTVIFLACAMVFAQEGSIKPEFQAFSGALIKLKKAEKGFHKFRLRVDVAEEYNVGFFDMMLYYDEEPTRIRNLSFKLLPPANDSWAQSILDDALQSGSLLGRIWSGKYEREITKASAVPIDKTKLVDMQQKRQAAKAAEAERKAQEEADRRAREKAEKTKLKSKKVDLAKQKRRCKMNGK